MHNGASAIFPEMYLAFLSRACMHTGAIFPDLLSS